MELAEEGAKGEMEERTAEDETLVPRARGGRTDSRDVPDGSLSVPRPNPDSSRSISGGGADGAGNESFGRWMWSRPGPGVDGTSASSACACAANSKNVVSLSSASMAPKSTSSRSAMDRLSGVRAAAPFSIMRASATAWEKEGKTPSSPPSPPPLPAGAEIAIPPPPERDATALRPAAAFRSAMGLKPRTPSWRPCRPRPALHPDSCNSATRWHPPSLSRGISSWSSTRLSWPCLRRPGLSPSA